ncbi:RHS repeat-associated core domain-containing protein [Xanthomonas sacchari]|uniref:RHS repeat-associated core domain-containing protein n=1 Tax=Xanthomonas sacchari TaxID=56458 RepID=UPI002258BEBD|nr:RHS repeat-associated core domain-containing protein [Xanthomonas sacchari]
MRKVESTSRIDGSNSQGRVMSNFQGIRAAMRLIVVAALSLLVAFGASAQTVRYIHTDGLGSPILVTDKDRNVVERSEYEPYGDLLNRSITDGPGYTGHVTDAATSLTYMQQRYYDQKIGRFLSVDPVTALNGNQKFFGRYSYSFDNPYTLTDPDGRCPICAGVVIYLTIEYANAPAVGEKTYSTPPGEQIAAAIPAGGRAVAAIKTIARQSEKVAEKAQNKLPNVPRGPGSVPPDQRDPQRYFPTPQREAKQAEQDYKCANGCGKDIDLSNAHGHHIERHADGGRTVSENHAEVCTECHKKIHSGRNQ